VALANTGKAIGKISSLLREHLEIKTGANVTVRRPEPPSEANNGQSNPRLNLFLYEALFDASMKNVSLDEGQQPPLWLVLKYLITPFDDGGESDTAEAHEYLGEGVRALQELSHVSLSSIPLPAEILPALLDNPEVLKITFDEAPSDLLSKLMQGADEKYRFSMAFQVRPVMIAIGEPPAYPPFLVGIDYTAAPPDVIGDAGVQIPVLPSMGPAISEVVPARFESDDVVTLLGSNLHLSDLSVRLGPAELPVIAQQPDRLRFPATVEGLAVSAGSHAVSVVQALRVGHARTSNLLVGALAPTLATAGTNALVSVPPPPPLPPAPLHVAGQITMEGRLLGRPGDDIFVALYLDGRIVRMFDRQEPPPSSETRLIFPPDGSIAALEQSELTLQIENADAVPPGTYRIILRVNGQQAPFSPEVNLVV